MKKIWKRIGIWLARRLWEEKFTSLLRVQADNLSGGPYMYGLYNGMLLIACLLWDAPYYPLTILESQDPCTKES
jgi:hypothetical protein